MSVKRCLIAATVWGVLSATGFASAAPAQDIGQGGTPPGQGGCPPGQQKKGLCTKAPEIDAAAGVQAAALLTGVLLLLGDRARRLKS